MPWSAAQYLAFEAERTRPVRDLLHGLPGDVSPARALDVGCGPANSTETLRARFPLARIQGLDSSADMIAAARKRLPDIDFVEADLRSWRPPEPVDLILSNAVLQWTSDHEAIIPSLLSWLSPGGVLAVQMPFNFEEPAQRIMRDLAQEDAFASKLQGVDDRRDDVRAPAWYVGLLADRCASVDVWVTIYHHRLAGVDAIVEWFKGSALRPYLAALDAEAASDFLARYREGVAAAYPLLRDGSVLLPFPRLFLIARV